MTFKEATWDWVQDTTTATSKWGAIGDWDVSSVEDFSFAFSQDRNALGGSYVNNGNPKVANFVGTDISKWITTSLTTLSRTFYNAGEMNADLSGWRVGKVTSLQSTFYKDGGLGKSKFAGIGLDSWDTVSVTTLSGTFFGASEMNADLSAWKVGKVTTLSNLFERASKFAGVGLNSWDISKVTSLMNIFKDATSLTSCSKRKIVDAWTSNSVFTDTTYDTDWAGETCPKVRDCCEER